MLVSEMAYPAGGMNGKSKRAFYSTPEDNYGNLAQYYDIPTISFRWVGLHSDVCASCVCKLGLQQGMEPGAVL